MNHQISCSRVKFCLNVCLNNTRSCHTGASSVYQKLNIPYQIKRKPTDLLKVLASTVRVDSTSFPYKYIDDPYCYPMDYMEWKQNGLSKEFGRKTARWIMNKHPEFFTHQPHDPIIKKFLPQKLYTDESVEYKEEDLKTCIETFRVADAVRLYESCQTNRLELALETKQALLELVCFYNGIEQLELEYNEEYFFRNVYMDETVNNTWNHNSIAKPLFDSIVDEAGAKAYGAIIRGMCKYGEYVKAWALYEESLSRDIALDAPAIAGLIKAAPHVKDQGQESWKLVTDMLKQMQTQGLVPCLTTLNATLESIRSMTSMGNRRLSLAFQTLNEFVGLGVRPSLASYCSVLKLYYRNQYGRDRAMMLYVLNLAEEEGELEMRTPEDANFFALLMWICFKGLQSFDIAKRINALLSVGNNHRFLNSSASKNSYYHSYLMLAMNVMSIAEFLIVLDTIVPSEVPLRNDTTVEMLRMCFIHDDLSHIPRVFSYASTWNSLTKATFLDELLLGLLEQPLQDADTTLKGQLRDILWQTWEKMETTFKSEEEDAKEGRESRRWSAMSKTSRTGLRVGQLAQLLYRLGKANETKHILDMVEKEPNFICGDMHAESITDMLKTAIENDDYNNAFKFVEFARSIKMMEVIELERILAGAPHLPDSLRSQLNF